MTGPPELQEGHSPSGPAADHRGHRSRRASTGDLQPGLHALTQVAGLALFGMGVLDPDESLLEPIARVIHSLGAAGQSDEHQCEPG
jgi:hypothetical protein